MIPPQQRKQHESKILDAGKVCDINENKHQYEEWNNQNCDATTEHKINNSNMGGKTRIMIQQLNMAEPNILEQQKQIYKIKRME